MTKCGKAALFFCIALSASVLSGCSGVHKKPVVIWTNRAEFVSYAEVFNASQSAVRAIVVYKQSPVESFPPARDEETPDIVIGPWLKNTRVRKNFMALDYLFNGTDFNPSNFYLQLLDTGSINGRQYLLPVSFNLPLIIFDTNEQKRLPDDYLISLDQLQEAGAAFNSKNRSGIYTSMGFAPAWDPGFLYLTAKLRGTAFQESGNSFKWHNGNLAETVEYLRAWTLHANTSTGDEEDFKFKYLYMPAYRQVQTGHSLFAYMTSDIFFNIAAEQQKNIDYRWIHRNNAIPVEDRMISMGLYKHSKNVAAAEIFIRWFMQESSQRAMLERNADMKLNVSTFGIAGGFSAVRKVTERVFPVFYPALLRNLPAADFLDPPNILPAYWENMKERVLFPYLTDAVDTKKEQPEHSMEERISEWNKQYF